MQLPFGLILAVLLCMTVPAAASDDSWDAFRAFKSRFYVLDEQPFDSIACAIEASNLDLDPIRQSLRPVQKSVRIDENLSAFRMEYRRNRGLSFTVPALRISMVTDEGVPDREKLQLYIDLVTQAFSSQVEQVTALLEGVFEDYQLPRPQRIQIQNFTELVEGGATYTLPKDGRTSVHTYQSQKLRSMETGEGVTIESQLQYTILWGKLILRQANAHIVTPEGANDIIIDVHYGSIATITFPSKLGVTDSKGQYEIILNKCEKK